MQHGVVWESVCKSCGKLASLDCRWQEEEPTGACPHVHSCCDDMTADARWERGFVKQLGYMRLSGFSTSESDFTPHWNRAFGKPVRSLAEMKALQEKHEVSDAIVKGDGAERHVPRDIGRRVKRHNELREAVESGQTEFDAGHGVKVKFSDATEAD